ncbi:MAG: pyridoxamine 5'-phosphate oxidase family protein [Actinomycetes bacterium]|jgi:uncharacterized pyridoxamine 5'-phosphate oxidase family protein|nr:pyridoxamine 5'-phosphate oxidase family protein [Actinomycetes bacterium]
MEEVLAYLQKVRTFYLATADGDQPRVRPFGAAVVWDDKLYLCTGNTKNVYRQLVDNPKVEISAFDGEEWLRLTANFVVDDRREAKAAFLEALPDLRRMYDEDDDVFAVGWLADATAQFCSFTAPPRTLTF